MSERPWLLEEAWAQAESQLDAARREIAKLTLQLSASRKNVEVSGRAYEAARDDCDDMRAQRDEYKANWHVAQTKFEELKAERDRAVASYNIGAFLAEGDEDSTLKAAIARITELEAALRE